MRLTLVPLKWSLNDTELVKKKKQDAERILEKHIKIIYAYMRQMKKVQKWANILLSTRHSSKSFTDIA